MYLIINNYWMRFLRYQEYNVIKVEATLTETLIILDIAKTESNNNYCFIIHCFTGKQNNGKRFQHLCPFRVFRLLNAFFLKVFVEQFLRNFVSLLLFSESFCFSNFSISCSVEEANR